MYGSPVAAQQRLFHLAVSVDREILQHQPTLAGAIRDRLLSQVEPACSVSVEPFDSQEDFPGFTVEASSSADVEDLGARGASRLASGLQWVEDQATEILDRIFYPSSVEVQKPLRATLALALAISGRLALGLVLAILLPLSVAAQETRLDLSAIERAAAPVGAFEVELDEDGGRSLLERAVLYVPGSWGDALTTEYFLAAGGQELNPMLRSRWVRLPVKLVVEPLMSGWLEGVLESRFGKNTARAFRVGMWVIRGAVMVHNTRLGHDLRSGR